MPVFVTKELDANGNMIESSYSVEQQSMVLNLIREKGNRPVKIEVQKQEPKKGTAWSFMKPKVKAKLLSLYCKQLYTMLHSGMPLLQALDVLEEQTENKYLRQVTQDVSNRMKKGDSYSTAMRAHKGYFPDILLSMIAAGELTGNLDDVMERMSVHFTKEDKINRKIKGAMMYPTIILIAAIGAVIALMIIVVPTFVKMFEDSGSELPGITKFVLNFSNSLRYHWYIYLLVVGGLILGIRFFLSTPKGKKIYDYTLFRIKGIRGPVSKIATSRFTRTMSTLLSSGIQLIVALETSAYVTGNQYVIDQIDDVCANVRKGSPLAVLLGRTGVFPRMMVSMVGTGEEAGALEEMLDKTADYYDEELDSAISSLLGILQPVLIIIVAAIVGVIVIAILVPMLTLFTTIQ